MANHQLASSILCRLAIPLIEMSFAMNATVVRADFGSVMLLIPGDAACGGVF